MGSLTMQDSTTTATEVRRGRYDIIQVPVGHHIRDHIRHLAALLTVNEREKGSVRMWEAVCIAVQRECERQRESAR